MNQNIIHNFAIITINAYFKDATKIQLASLKKRLPSEASLTDSNESISIPARELHSSIMSKISDIEIASELLFKAMHKPDFEMVFGGKDSSYFDSKKGKDVPCTGIYAHFRTYITGGKGADFISDIKNLCMDFGISLKKSGKIARTIGLAKAGNAQSAEGVLSKIPNERQFLELVFRVLSDKSALQYLYNQVLTASAIPCRESIEISWSAYLNMVTEIKTGMFEPEE